jgi:hypothetical protein
LRALNLASMGFAAIKREPTIIRKLAKGAINNLYLSYLEG